MGFNLPKVSGEVFFETFPVGPLQCNCSIIADPITKACVIVDPGGDPERIMSIAVSYTHLTLPTNREV